MANDIPLPVANTLAASPDPLRVAYDAAPAHIRATIDTLLALPKP